MGHGMLRENGRERGDENVEGDEPDARLPLHQLEPLWYQFHLVSEKKKRIDGISQSTPTRKVMTTALSLLLPPCSFFPFLHKRTPLQYSQPARGTVSHSHLLVFFFSPFLVFACMYCIPGLQYPKAKRAKSKETTKQSPGFIFKVLAPPPLFFAFLRSLYAFLF